MEKQITWRSIESDQTSNPNQTQSDQTQLNSPKLSLNRTKLHSPIKPKSIFQGHRSCKVLQGEASNRTQTITDFKFLHWRFFSHALFTMVSCSAFFLGKFVLCFLLWLNTWNGFAFDRFVYIILCYIILFYGFASSNGFAFVWFASVRFVYVILCYFFSSSNGLFILYYVILFFFLWLFFYLYYGMGWFCLVSCVWFVYN